MVGIGRPRLRVDHRPPLALSDFGRRHVEWSCDANPMLRAFGGNKLRYRFQTFTFLNEACSILVGRSHQELAGWNENENHLFAIGQINGFFNLGAQMLGPGGLMGLGPGGVERCCRMGRCGADWFRHRRRCDNGWCGRRDACRAGRDSYGTNGHAKATVAEAFQRGVAPPVRRPAQVEPVDPSAARSTRKNAH